MKGGPLMPLLLLCFGVRLNMNSTFVWMPLAPTIMDVVALPYYSKAGLPCTGETAYTGMSVPDVLGACVKVERFKTAVRKGKWKYGNGATTATAVSRKSRLKGCAKPYVKTLPYDCFENPLSSMN